MKRSHGGRREVQGSKRLMYNILLVLTDGVRGTVTNLPLAWLLECNLGRRLGTPCGP